MFALMGCINNCYSLTIIPITAYFGVSRATYAVSQTCMILASTLFSAFSYKIYQRFDMVLCIRVAAVAAPLTMFLLSFAPHVTFFYPAYFIMGFCVAMAGTIPVSLLINQWMTSSANSYIGIAMMGSGLGGALFQIIQARLIAGLGWQNNFRITACCMAVMTLFAAFVLIRRRPDAAGGGKVNGKAIGKSARLLQPRVIGFSLLAVAIFASGNSLNFSFVPHLRDSGASAEFAATCGAIMMFVMAVGKIIYGRLIDKLGIRTCIRISITVFIISMLAMAFMGQPYAIFIPLAFLGMLLGAPFGTVGVSAAALEIGGPEYRASNLAAISTFGSIASTVVPMLLGKVYDITGSYSPVYLGNAVLTL
ncbi:MAG: MFS transporter, partial [Firmicutes bacterium]|nr:MFS transporter [Bacillota bacterium]